MSQYRYARMIRTPKYHIPLFEAVRNRDGSYILIIKKAKGQEKEEIPLDGLMRLVLAQAADETVAAPRRETHRTTE